MMKILLVEDDPGVRVSIRAYLQDLGHTTCEATDGMSALDLFREEKPELVLCDLRLPRMDGLDVLTCIRETAPETPVIIVSGANRMADAIQALKRGAWDYICKPIVDLEILGTAMRRCQERVRLIRENREYKEHLERINGELSTALKQLRDDAEAAQLLQTGMLPKGRTRLGPYLFRQRIFTSMYLSGDFIDFFSIDSHRTGFYLADVSGHGAASALVTAMLKTLLGKYREPLEGEDFSILCSPEIMLDRLNRDFCQFGMDKYLTIFYGVLNDMENSLHYASAGQFPYPLLRTGTQLEPLTGHDQPVGLFEETTYHRHGTKLPGCFDLLLVSDGILELLPGDDGRSRFEQLVARVMDVGPEIDLLVQAFAIDQQRKLPDDISFLTLSRGSCS